jgi:hypothetical protein
MNKTIEINTTTAVVKEVLKAHEKARNCDDYLYFLVCSIIGQQNGFDVENMTMAHFLLYRKEFKLPSYETVGRARRKIQQCHPELAGSDVVEGYRTANEEPFKRYARAVNV